jgi:predicted O-linked N-acetylglucosamine transferase (SPINDLY family)
MKGDAESGMSSLLEATVIAPGEPKLRYYQGKALFLLNDHAQALESFLDYCEKTPEKEWTEDIHSMIGLCYLMLGDLDRSIMNLERALLVNPNDLHALINAFNAYRSAGEVEKSIDCCQRAISIEALSDENLHFKSFSNLMLLYSTLGTNRIEDARNTAEVYWSARASQKQGSTNHRTKCRSSNSRVKIGIISSEIGDHVVSLFLEPLLRHYPQSLVELELVLTSCRYENSTDRLLSLPEKILNISTANQQSARELILDRNYDIIVETTGYTANSSLELLFQRCAPIQCHYIGYHASTFAPNIDWFIADDELIPAFIESQFTENILRIEGPWISRYIPANLPIAEYKGNQERFVMGSTNQSAKLSRQTFEFWAEALHEVQNSILIVKDRFALTSRVQQRLFAFMDEQKIAKDRLIFRGVTPDWQEHMDFYNNVDVIIDATPWSASTTAFDTLLMGTPFVAIRGNVAAARMSSSILRAAGLDELIADDITSFKKIVKQLSLHKELHRRHRQMYQERNLCSAAFDPEGVAGKVFRALLDLV